MRLLISGGPGSGCTSTAEEISKILGIPLFDTDSFFHKPSDPPFQEQYSHEERRMAMDAALSSQRNWIVSGSVATWEIGSFNPTHGVFLNIPTRVRHERLLERQKQQFGDRVDCGGDMHDEHIAFMDWADGYEERSGIGRNLPTDREFLFSHCESFISIEEPLNMEIIVEKITKFLKQNHGESRGC